MRAPFPYFGGKSRVAQLIWQRLGTPTQYIEPFCGSAALLLAAPKPASLEVVGDLNGFIANFWRAVKHQPGRVAEWADYPVSHIDLGARHGWLMAQREQLGLALQDPDWPGDAKVAGWWLWGQCAWIGSGWCDWFRERTPSGLGQIPHVSNAGMGIQAIGKISHVSNAEGELLTSGGRTAWRWLHELAQRLERVRIIHGSWERCLNHRYGGDDTAVVLDPPYGGYEAVYGKARPVAQDVGEWGRAHAHLRIAVCGHRGEYDLPGWDVTEWSRSRNTYAGTATKDQECIWFSPACLPRCETDSQD